MVAVKTGFTPPPVPGMPAPMQPMMPMGGAPARNPFAPMPPMPLAGMPPPPAQPPMAQQPMPQMQQQGSNAPRRKRFGDSLEGMLSRNQGLGSMAAQRRPLPMPPQMMPQPRMVAPGTPMMRTPTPRPMAMGGEVDIFGYDDGGLVIRTLSDGNAYIDFGGGAYHHVSPSFAGQDVVASLQSAYGDRISDVTAATADQEADIMSRVATTRGSSTTDNTTSTTNNTTTTNNNNTATTNNNTATTTVGDTSQNTAAMTGDIGSSGTGADTASLFGPNINIPEKASQFVQNPVTGQITTTAGPTMTAVSPIGAINLPATPVSIDIFDYLGDPTYGTLLDKEVEGMAQDGSVQGFDMGGHAHPHSSNSSIGPSGYTSLDAIANQAVQDDDDVSFKHMGKTYDNVSDYHKAIFGDDDDDDDSPSYPDTPPPGTGTSTSTSTGTGTVGSGSSSAPPPPPAPPTPVVYKDMYGRTYGSQAEADAANRMIMQAQDDKPDRTIDKEIAGPDLAYDDALALTQGVIPPQFSGAVPPGSQFSYGNIGGIGDTSSGFNLPPAVVDPDVGDDNLRFLNKANMYSIGEYNTDPDSISNIINLDAPVSGTTYPNAPPPGTGTTTASTTSGIQPASSNIIPESFNPDNNTSTGSPSYSTAVVPGSGTTAQNLNQGLGNVKPEPRPNLGNQTTGSTTTGGGDPGYRPPPNAAETAYLQNLLGQFEFDDQGKMVFAEPNVVEKVLNQIVSNLSLGTIDLEDLNNEKVQAVLDAYKKTGKFAYDSEGNAINLETIADLEKLEGLSSGSGIEPAVIGVYDSEGNIVSYGPDIMNTQDGPVVVNNTDIFGSDSNGSSSNTTTDGPDLGHTVDEDGNIVCNTAGYIYNPETGVCEPPKETEESDDVNVNIGSGASGTSFDDVLANVVIPAPDIAPISANIQPMKMGGMAGLNRAADNFIKALAG